MGGLEEQCCSMNINTNRVTPEELHKSTRREEKKRCEDTQKYKELHQKNSWLGLRGWARAQDGTPEYCYKRLKMGRPIWEEEPTEFSP